MAESNTKTSENLQMLFVSASSYVKSLISKLTNQQILEFYGLYKQATEGPCVKPKPNWYEITEKSKWEVWSSLKNMSSKEAMQKYIDLLNLIEPNWSEKPIENSNVWVHHSCLKNNDEIIADSNKTICDWIKEKNFEKVKSCGTGVISDVNKLDSDGLTLLHWAADRGSLDIVKYLVEQLKANVDIRDSNGQTPLHYAVSCEHNDVVKYLIESGADINIKDNDGQTPYEVVI